MTDNQEEKFPWIVRHNICLKCYNECPDDCACCPSNMLRSNLLTVAQVPVEEARQILEDRKRLSMLEEALKKYEQSRFLVFSCEHYYPSGGWEYFREAFATLEEAKEFISKDRASSHNSDDYQIIDLKTMEQVY